MCYILTSQNLKLMPPLVPGVLLLLKKNVAWIQPPTAKGSSTELAPSFEEILEATNSTPPLNYHG